MQVISYGYNYWQVEYGLDVELDPEVFQDKPKVIQVGTKRLLQLIVLSRVSVPDFEEGGNWAVPTGDGTKHVMQEMRQELGVADEFACAAEVSLFSPDFPGASDGTIVDAILSNKVTIGNFEQPEPQLWRP